MDVVVLRPPNHAAAPDSQTLPMAHYNNSQLSEPLRTAEGGRATVRGLSKDLAANFLKRLSYRLTDVVLVTVRFSECNRNGPLSTTVLNNHYWTKSPTFVVIRIASESWLPTQCGPIVFYHGNPDDIEDTTLAPSHEWNYTFSWTLLSRLGRLFSGTKGSFNFNITTWRRGDSGGEGKNESS